MTLCMMLMPERRRRRRILTLKNFAGFIAALVIAFAGLTFYSARHRAPATGDYGRLFGKQVSGQTEIQPKKVEIVAPPIEDQNAADPLLVDAQRREQYLRDETTTTVEPQPQVSSTETVATETPQPSQPLLTGGIFRK